MKWSLKSSFGISIENTYQIYTIYKYNYITIIKLGWYHSIMLLNSWREGSSHNVLIKECIRMYVMGGCREGNGRRVRMGIEHGSCGGIGVIHRVVKTLTLHWVVVHRVRSSRRRRWWWWWWRGEIVSHRRQDIGSTWHFWLLHHCSFAHPSSLHWKSI